MASWGEPMCLEAGDYLASGTRLADGSIAEIIRIEKWPGSVDKRGFLKGKRPEKWEFQRGFKGLKSPT